MLMEKFNPKAYPSYGWQEIRVLIEELILRNE